MKKKTMQELIKSQENVLPFIPRSIYKSFGQASPKPSGPGSSQILEAQNHWNNGNYDAAYNLYLDAIREGIQKDWLATAHNCLGQIEIKRGNLHDAVMHFIKCMQIPEHDAVDLWESEIRLYSIYDEAGRWIEADVLKQYATLANTRGLALSPEGEIELRTLTRNSIDKMPTAKEGETKMDFLRNLFGKKQSAISPSNTPSSSKPLNLYVLVGTTKPVSESVSREFALFGLDYLKKEKKAFKERFDECNKKLNVMSTTVSISGDINGPINNNDLGELYEKCIKEFIEWQPSHHMIMGINHFFMGAKNNSRGLKWGAIYHFDN